MCESYNRQYGTSFIAAMPTNLYGQNDNFDLETSHVLPALIRKFHLAKLAATGDWEAIGGDERRFGPIPDDFRQCLISISNLHGHNHPLPAARYSLPSPSVVLWGSGKPRREFLHADDLAAACVFIMNIEDKELNSFFAAHRTPLINIGCGKDTTIKDLAMIIKTIAGFEGETSFDQTKPDGTARKLLDISRMTTLGWKPKISLEDGIKQTYDWFLGALDNAQLAADSMLQGETVKVRYGDALTKQEKRNGGGLS
jgi:GDP-L-fucose synthase